MFDVPMSVLPEVRDSAGDFGLSDPSVLGQILAHPWGRRRSAGGAHRTGMLCRGRRQEHVRNRRVLGAQHRAASGAVEEPPAQHHRLSIERRGHLCAGGIHSVGGQRRAVAARRARAHLACPRHRGAGGVGAGQRWRLPRAGVHRTRSALLGSRRARRHSRADARHVARGNRPRDPGQRRLSNLRSAGCDGGGRPAAGDAQGGRRDVAEQFAHAAIGGRPRHRDPAADQCRVDRLRRRLSGGTRLRPVSIVAGSRGVEPLPRLDSSRR